MAHHLDPSDTDEAYDRPSSPSSPSPPSSPALAPAPSRSSPAQNQNQIHQTQAHSTFDFTPGLVQPNEGAQHHQQNPQQQYTQAQLRQIQQMQMQARMQAQQQAQLQAQAQAQAQAAAQQSQAQLQAQQQAQAQHQHAQVQAAAQAQLQQQQLRAQEQAQQYAQQQAQLRAQQQHAQLLAQQQAQAQSPSHSQSTSSPSRPGHEHDAPLQESESESEPSSEGESEEVGAAGHRHHHHHGGHKHKHTHTPGQVGRGGKNDYPTLNHTPGAKWIKHLTRSRLDTFTGGHYADVDLSHVLFLRREDSDGKGDDGKEYVKMKVWSAPGLEKPLFEEAMKKARWRSVRKGERFGPSFEFDPGCEAMIFSTDGTPLQGITGGFGGDRRVDHIIPRSAIKAGVYEFVAESSCNGMFGVPWNGDTIAPPDMNRYFTLESADLVVPNQEAWRLLWDFEALKQVVESVPGNTVLQNKALVAANEIMNVFGRGDKAGIKRARKLAEGVFGKGWEAKGEKIYEEGAGRASIWGIGHCHIDTAWLWPYRVTQQKVARSWSTQIDLMERYPEHRFAASSAQQYKWLEEQYPKLFDKVKQKVKEGKFHLVGGSWVENDSNMPSGEALVRQFLYAQRFFESRFGVRCETAWLPDSFGLTGALPQLIRGAGMKYFFTQKLSWNNINTFPHSTFNWVGLDGTQVLCHMTPVDTYTAQATVGDVKKGLENHKNLESSDTALLVFGNGDGGGGPLNKMLENLRRIRGVTNTHRELPPVSMGSSVDEFFCDLEEHTDEGKKLPNWHGELYLEFHRGTYTSHGSIKKGNRHSEVLLRHAELLSTIASIKGAGQYVYPKRQIDECWEKVLLNQFHDVLPGSSIGMVYDDAEKLYAEVKHTGEALIEEALSVLFPSSTSLSPSPFINAKVHSRILSASTKIVAFNTTFFPRVEVVKVPLSKMTKEVKSMVLQASDDGKEGYAVVACAEGAAVGEVVSPSNRLRSKLMPVSVYTNGSDHFVMRNSSVQLTIADGRITSLLDVKTDRELIAKGQTGGLVIFQDRPNYWDAWDVEIHHLEVSEQLKFENVSVVAQGPVYGAVRAEVKYGESTVVLTISLSATGATAREGSRSLLNFDAQVDWHQRHEFLKFELPLDIHSDHATYETQFGHLQRPTHKNTTWDMAKFEVCGHKFADLSEFGYGVAILSESKYGFSCLGNVLRISLLRSATAPDAEQDQGAHHFSWGVYPHTGGFLESDVPVAGFLYNSPIRVRALPPSAVSALTPNPPLTIEGSRNVFLETVKRGEDDSFDDPVNLEDEEDFTSHKKGKSTIVLRLYEAYGGHGTVAFKISRRLPIVKAFITNLLEDHEEELDIERVEDSGSLVESGTEGGASVKLRFRGFEVKTLKLVLGSNEDLTSPVKSVEEEMTYPPPAAEKRGKRSSWVDVDEEQLAI